MTLEAQAGGGLHTAGPWYVTETDEFIRIRQESSDAVLATMEDGTHPELELVPWRERLANAHRIVTAVNSHDLLVASLEECRDRIAKSIGDYNGILGRAEAALRAAIQLAEGR